MRARTIVFAVVTVCSVAAIVAVFISSAGKAGDSGPAPSAVAAINTGDLLAVTQEPSRPQAAGRVVVLPGGSASAARRVTPLRCKRVAYAAGSGICVVERRVFPTRAYAARFFDADQRIRGSVDVNGFPSRTRVSPGGRYAASTTFVRGDSYVSEGAFSTRTVVFDARRAKALANLEEFTVTKSGERIRSPDFNFWGVTFDGDDGDFYATLGTGDHHYLVRGNVETRSAEVLRDGIECPSLSPDGTRIAFKARVGDPFQWRLRVLDLRTGSIKELPAGDGFDDQAEWLDDEHLAFDRNQLMMRIRADGSSRPTVMLEKVGSAAAVR